MMQHRSPIGGVAAFRDTYVLTAGYDNQVILWDQTEKRAIARSWHDHLANQASFSSDGQYALTSSSDYGARLWTVPDLRLVAVLAAQDDIANGCAGLGGGVFASVSRDLLLRIWGTDREPVEVVTPHTHSIKCVSASSDGRYVATGSYNGRIAVYDRVASEWTAVQRPTTAGISSLAYDDGRGHFLAASYDGRVYLVNE